MGPYVINAANEPPDPDKLAFTRAESYLSYIRNSPNPQRAFEVILEALDTKIREQA